MKNIIRPVESRIPLVIHPFTRLLLSGRCNYASHRSKDAVQVTQERSVNPSVAERPVYTVQEYLDKDDPSQLRSRELVAKKIDEATDNPMWMIYGLMFLAFLIANLIVGGRLRKEVQSFDPKMREVRKFEQPGGVRIGGEFELIDTNGNTVKSTDLRGKFLYIYFGFTNCPDICPAEMEKMSRVITQVDKRVGADKWQPIFITIDPERDTKEVLKDYLSDFNPRILGLTGSCEEIERLARAYKVYYAIPEDNTNPDDYLIDHSIMMYLMGPDGKFVDYTTKDFNWVESIGKIFRRILDHERKQKKNLQSVNEQEPSNK
ncbi:electon transport protein SCO1/SCO2 [Perkinsela sp. CCAP 1560/4]|nr:electon transport protein SCO1/SCO2 [Perkinsela sp. CCAP 1560/4]|eukprot:KNH04463.1 electon transport protein SCO1/SCO2 [Perkinsela sp. CCAP 1560/4]